MSVKVVKSEKGIDTIRIENGKISAEIITYGGRVTKLCVENKYGETLDVVGGFDTVDEYLAGDYGTYFGAIIGRVGNRIAGGSFTQNGKVYNLYKNDGNNHLHGGKEGFDKKIWKVIKTGDNFVTLGYLSKDGEEGYPSNLDVKVTYELKVDALCINYQATSDGDTPCSLTNHTYFNLDGDFKSILDHEIFINSHAVTDVNEELIPSGKLLPIEGTPLDFSVPKTVRENLDLNDRLIRIAKGGYDFNYVLDKDCNLKGEDLAFGNLQDDAVLGNLQGKNHETNEVAAEAYSKKSGIKMSVYTDFPCMQFYTGNFLSGFKGKTEYPYQSAFCMETQLYPNACNVSEFPSATLKKGEEFKHFTVYKFDIVK